MNDSKTDAQLSIKSLELDILPGEYYTHFKGGVYQVITLGVKEDTAEPVVIYKSLKNGNVWVRTVNNWNQQVPILGGYTPRFKKGAP